MRRSVWGQSRVFPRLLPGLVVLALLAGLALLDATLAPRPPPIVGHAEAVDGDTLRLGRQRIRLTGLDAPELRQSCVDAAGAEWPCGAAARDFVVQQLQSGELSCSPSGRDIYRRTLASCSIGGADLGRAIVEAGWAVAELPYAGEEGDARAARRGIWTGSFEPPSQWRHDHGEGAASPWDWIRSWFQ